MQTLYVELKLLDSQWIELRYYFDRESQHYEPQRLNLSQIQNLIDLSERDFYVALPDLVEIGKQLFVWLDGNGRWLSRGISNCGGEGLLLAISSEKRLGHLPWEVLHDGEQFLVDRISPMVAPVRWTKRKVEVRPEQKRPLRVLFMATSPEPPVEPILDFEQEEACILESTKGIPLNLRVEESGCIEELGKLWSQYPQDYFDAFHLTGHASIKVEGKQSLPYFVTENIDGSRHDTTAREIADALRFRFPQLVFLSGCRTGQAGNEGAMPSMAQELINQGFRAVLAWGYPIADESATDAAAHLYSELAAGYELSQALISTYRKLRENKVKDWHFLRLYVGGECPGAFVTHVNHSVWQQPEIIEDAFLDPNDLNSPKVATRKNFVGRRRTLQRCLQHLRTSLGVLIYGIGGVGKSTLAKRLLERFSGYESIVNYQIERSSDYEIIVYSKELDSAKLLLLLEKQCLSNKGLEILNSSLPLMQKLTSFLSSGLNYPSQRMIFVLDDFEANLETNAKGEHVLKSKCVDTLDSLFEAVKQSKLSHRIIITCRYNFVLPNSLLDCRLFREQLTALLGADLRKKLDRLQAFNNISQVDPALQERAITVADGNPRLLEWLAKILPSGEVDRELILSKIEDKAAEYRVDILAEALLAQQSDELRQMLSLGLIFDLPVPRPAFESICQNIANLDRHIHRASNLGLLEIAPGIELLRFPRILEPFLNFPSQPESFYRVAANSLYECWWIETKNVTEEQQREIYRLAVLGQETAIALEVAIALTDNWLQRNRYLEVQKVCQETLTLLNDYRILYNLAQSEQFTGETDNALEHIQQALHYCPVGDEDRKARIIALLAGLLMQKKKGDQAEPLYEQVQTVGDVQGKAEALVSLAILKSIQDFNEADRLIRQAIQIHRNLGNTQGIAQALSCWAMIKAQQGCIDRAINLHQRSIQISRSINNPQKLADTLQAAASLYLQLGQLEQAGLLLEEAIQISDHIGEIQNQIGAMLSLGTIGITRENLDDALASFQQALKLCDQIGNQLIKPNILYEIGMVYALQGKLSKAIDCLEQSVDLSQNTDNVGMQVQALLMLGRLNSEFIKTIIEQGFAEAITDSAQALELSKHIGNKQLTVLALAQLAELYLAQGDEEEAIRLYYQGLEESKSPGTASVKVDILAALGILLAKKEAQKGKGQFRIPLQYLQTALETLQQLDPSVVNLRVLSGQNFTEELLIDLIEEVQQMEVKAVSQPNKSETDQEAVEALQKVANILKKGDATQYQQFLNSINSFQRTVKPFNCPLCQGFVAQEDRVCSHCGVSLSPVLSPHPLPDGNKSHVQTKNAYVAQISLKRDGALATETFKVTEKATVGRFDGNNGPNEIDLGNLLEGEGKHIARYHAEVWCDSSGQWFIKGLDAKTPTFIRPSGQLKWQRIQSERVINDGAEIALGKTQFKFSTM